MAGQFNASNLAYSPWSTKQQELKLSSGETIFYREAGNAQDPTLLLLHGFPSSSFYFRDAIPILASHGYHVIAPDFPGFGFTTVPEGYKYTFENMTMSISGWLKALPNPVEKFAMYVFDYGAPIGFRLALENPSAVTAIVSQNGNAYEGGLRGGFDGIKNYWAKGDAEARNSLKPVVTLETTKWQYMTGTVDPTKVAPETYTLDGLLLTRPGQQDIQLDLFLDYQHNVALYPKFQEYFRNSQVPLIAVWGKDDPFFGQPELFKKDLPKAEIHELAAGHLALESNLEEILALAIPFLKKHAS